jgi:hypothetical protein
MNPIWIAEAVSLILTILRALEAHDAPAEKQAAAIQSFHDALQQAIATKNTSPLENILGIITSTVPSLLDAPQGSGRNSA